MSRRKLAVVLFNLGGPDGPAAVRPFLFNLFNDPAIIGLPWPARTLLARLISTTRTKGAQANYAIMGGGSPLLPETQKQSHALEQRLAELMPDVEARCFIAMRYWKPFVDEAAKAVKAFAPDEVVLLPLYPQFSTTTTGSSLRAWRKAYDGPSKAVCCYPQAHGFAGAYADAIRQTAGDRAPGSLRLLFSAHGLPEKIVAAGDPYQAQVEGSVRAVMEELGPEWTDHEICYQSRVGPLKWLGPSTPEALAKAGAEKRDVLVIPIAFVSEHVETLVELDHEYAPLAREAGVGTYLRAPTVGVMAPFVDSLAEAVRRATTRKPGAETFDGGRWCDGCWSKCPAKAAA